MTTACCGAGNLHFALSSFRFSPDICTSSQKIDALSSPNFFTKSASDALWENNLQNLTDESDVETLNEQICRFHQKVKIWTDAVKNEKFDSIFETFFTQKEGRLKNTTESRLIEMKNQLRKKLQSSFRKFDLIECAKGDEEDEDESEKIIKYYANRFRGKDGEEEEKKGKIRRKNEKNRKLLGEGEKNLKEGLIVLLKKSEEMERRKESCEAEEKLSKESLETSLLNLKKKVNEILNLRPPKIMEKLLEAKENNATRLGKMNCEKSAVTTLEVCNDNNVDDNCGDFSDNRKQKTEKDEQFVAKTVKLIVLSVQFTFLVNPSFSAKKNNAKIATSKGTDEVSYLVAASYGSNGVFDEDFLAFLSKELETESVFNSKDKNYNSRKKGVEQTPWFKAKQETKIKCKNEKCLFNYELTFKIQDQISFQAIYARIYRVERNHTESHIEDLGEVCLHLNNQNNYKDLVLHAIHGKGVSGTCLARLQEVSQE